MRNLCVFECVCIPTSPSWCLRSCTNVRSGANTLARRTIRGDVRSGVRHTPGAPRRLNCASLLRCTCRVRAAGLSRDRLHRSMFGSLALDRFPNFDSRGPRATPRCALAEALPRLRQVESARLEMGAGRALRDLSAGFWLRTALFTRICRRSCSNSQISQIRFWRPISTLEARLCKGT